MRWAFVKISSNKSLVEKRTVIAVDAVFFVDNADELSLKLAHSAQIVVQWQGWSLVAHDYTAVFQPAPLGTSQTLLCCSTLNAGGYSNKIETKLAGLTGRETETSVFVLIIGFTQLLKLTSSRNAGIRWKRICFNTIVFSFRVVIDVLLEFPICFDLCTSVRI